jgi:hypothetical protein
MIPNPIRMYAPIADLDFMTAPPLTRSYQNEIKIQPEFLGGCPMGLSKMDVFLSSSLIFCRVGWKNNKWKGHVTFSPTPTKSALIRATGTGSLGQKPLTYSGDSVPR